ncbi:MAG TPA: acetate--CoA ligase family protein, partial [Mycobacteriales bacterium]|nr:acetate--CoA ligase family protein [Mycobacteriales bacterium]
LAADAAETAGLTVPELSPATQAALRAAAPRLAGAGNPVDLGAAAAPADYERTLRVLLASGEVDAVVAIHALVSVNATPPAGAPNPILTAIRRAAATTPDVPVAATLLGGQPTAAAVGPAPGQRSVPVYDFPEASVRALGHAARYADWRRRPQGRRPAIPPATIHATRSIATTELASHPAGGWLDTARAAELLAAFGVPVCPTIPVTTAADAIAAAERLGYPVVVKAGGRAVHKTETGGVQLDLRDADAVRAAFAAVTGTPGAAGTAVVQPTAAPGTELIVGATRIDPFPPLVMIGLGGTATELLGDRAVRLAPLTDTDARDAIRSLRAAPLLLGYRGRPPADLAAIEDVLLRVAALVDELPELAELDLNPVIATPGGALAVDVKVRLAPTAPGHDLDHDPLIRRLR